MLCIIEINPAPGDQKVGSIPCWFNTIRTDIFYQNRFKFFFFKAVLIIYTKILISFKKFISSLIFGKHLAKTKKKDVVKFNRFGR